MEAGGRDVGLWVHLLYTRIQWDLVFQGARPLSLCVPMESAGLWTDAGLCLA